MFAVIFLAKKKKSSKKEGEWCLLGATMRRALQKRFYIASLMISDALY